MDIEMMDNPDVLPANGHDICNYLARHGLANYQIQVIMVLAGTLDYDRLERAVRLTIETEPVLRCRFVENNPPYWKRRDNIEEIEFCSLVETDDVDEAVKRFSESPLDMDNDLMVKVRLVRSGGYDTLCVKINHACSDGAGAKEYVMLLSKIYSDMDRDNNSYRIKPRIGGRKDQDRLFNALGIENPEYYWNPLSEAHRSIWTFPWKKGRTNAARYAVCRFPAGLSDVISGYGKTKGATVNDLILTAYYRAMFEISKTPYNIPMDITTTIDLRRYLPNNKAEAIRNFSGGFVTRVERIKDEPFEETLSRIVNITANIKNGLPGLQNAIGGECVEKMSFFHINAFIKYVTQVSEMAKFLSAFPILFCVPGLSNLGIISRDLIKFGDISVIDAYVLPPAISEPGILLLACTYNGILTLSTGYYKGSVLRRDMEGLLNKIKDELMENCTMDKEL